MGEYKYYLKKIYQPTADVVVLELGDRTGRPVFGFKPGQYVMIAYKNENGGIERKHAFSLASSPTEKDHIRLGIKVMGRFTQGLLKLKEGADILVHGPFGSFVFDEMKHRNLVMIAGGVGITPFFSTLKYATDNELPNQLSLIYSNKTLAGTLFADEILELQKQNENIRTLFSFTDDKSSTLLAGSVHGRLTKEAMGAFLGGVYGKTFFICGSPMFMEAMKKNLIGLGAEEEQIETEAFSMISGAGFTARLKNFSYAMAFSGLLMLPSFYMISRSALAAYPGKKGLFGLPYIISSPTQASDISDSNSDAAIQDGVPKPVTSASGTVIAETVATATEKVAGPVVNTAKAKATPEPATYVSPTQAKAASTVKMPATKTSAKTSPTNTTAAPAPVTSSSIPASETAPTTSMTPNTTPTNQTTQQSVPAPTTAVSTAATTNQTAQTVTAPTLTTPTTATVSPTPTPTTAVSTAPVTSGTTNTTSPTTSNTTTAATTPTTSTVSPAPAPTTSASTATTATPPTTTTTQTTTPTATQTATASTTPTQTTNTTTGTSRYYDDD